MLPGGSVTAINEKNQVRAHVEAATDVELEKLAEAHLRLADVDRWDWQAKCLHCAIEAVRRSVQMVAEQQGLSGALNSVKVRRKGEYAGSKAESNADSKLLTPAAAGKLKPAQPIPREDLARPKNMTTEVNDQMARKLSPYARLAAFSCRPDGGVLLATP